LRKDSNRICQKSAKDQKRGTLSKIKQFTLEKLFKQARTNFRFNMILIMNAHILNDLTHMDTEDVASAGGKLIIGSPYNN
jgi:hypothetical protein